MSLKIDATVHGVALNNGHATARAGWGLVLHVNGAPFHLCAALTDASDMGRETNNRAELRGALVALLFLKKLGRKLREQFDRMANGRFTLRSDSRLVINGLTGVWNVTTHRDLWDALNDNLRRIRGRGAVVQLEYVRAHDGDEDNEKADELAGDAARDRETEIQCISCQEFFMDADELVMHIWCEHV